MTRGPPTAPHAGPAPVAGAKPSAPKAAAGMFRQGTSVATHGRPRVPVRSPRRGSADGGGGSPRPAAAPSATATATANHEGELERLRGELGGAQRRVHELETALERLKREHREAKDEARRHRKALEAAQERLKALDDHGTAHAELERLRATAAAQSHELEEHRRTAGAAQIRLDHLTERNTQLTRERMEIDRETQRQAAAHAESQQALQRRDAELAALKAENERLNRANAHLAGRAPVAPVAVGAIGRPNQRAAPTGSDATSAERLAELLDAERDKTKHLEAQVQTLREQSATRETSRQHAQAEADRLLIELNRLREESTANASKGKPLAGG